MSNTFLKIKIMSLAAEARIIRREEKKWPGTVAGSNSASIRAGLHEHRITVVRPEARVALLAYGYLRGRHYLRIENKASEAPDWSRVLTLVNKFGSAKIAKEDLAAWADPPAAE